ncbi:hypothetical protein [Desulfosporosinus nitroreducens]|uniref:Uncharacterized protein n=1 Tax=Desulfosporosinus nitroreducens TaxID=2018668 RepID=A0ABT8QJ20_9FIRM|nr:hypothetical protein [Desulfosporosinus nitroreducens]MDO0821301.1 hypothetical protein [Desulfosporosinus nitroreducens]
MNTFVIKAGGSGNIIETDFKHEIEWLKYRRIQIDAKYFSTLIESLTTASYDNKIVYVNGGVAAFIFIDLARNLGLDNENLDEIGCRIVNTTSYIILESLKNKSAKVYPELINPLEFRKEILNDYNLILIKAIQGFKSTDSLATYIASQVQESELMFFKKGIPIYHVGFESPTKVTEFKLSDLENIGAKVTEVPGNNAILDKESINIIKKKMIKTVLYNSDDIDKLDKIISGVGLVEKTMIRL